MAAFHELQRARCHHAAVLQTAMPPLFRRVEQSGGMAAALQITMTATDFNRDYYEAPNAGATTTGV